MPELPDLNPVVHGKLRLALLTLLTGVDDTGKVMSIAGPKSLRTALQKLRRASREHSHKQSGSANRRKCAARLARIRLYYSSNTPAFVRSHAALLSLIQALAYGVYARDAQQYDVRIKAFRLK